VKLTLNLRNDDKLLDYPLIYNKQHEKINAEVYTCLYDDRCNCTVEKTNKNHKYSSRWAKKSAFVDLEDACGEYRSRTDYLLHAMIKQLMYSYIELVIAVLIIKILQKVIVRLSIVVCNFVFEMFDQIKT
jgi:hypothetical protein